MTFGCNVGAEVVLKMNSWTSKEKYMLPLKRRYSAHEEFQAQDNAILKNKGEQTMSFSLRQGFRTCLLSCNDGKRQTEL